MFLDLTAPINEFPSAEEAPLENVVLVYNTMVALMIGVIIVANGIFHYWAFKQDDGDRTKPIEMRKLGDGITKPRSQADPLQYTDNTAIRWVGTVWNLTQRDHIFVACFYRCPKMKMTRLQKASALLATICGCASICALFYGEHIIEPNHFVEVGIISAIVTFPMIRLMLTMFASRPFRGNIPVDTSLFGGKTSGEWVSPLEAMPVPEEEQDDEDENVSEVNVRGSAMSPQGALPPNPAEKRGTSPAFEKGFLGAIPQPPPAPPDQGGGPEVPQARATPPPPPPRASRPTTPSGQTPPPPPQPPPAGMPPVPPTPPKVAGRPAPPGPPPGPGEPVLPVAGPEKGAPGGAPPMPPVGKFASPPIPPQGGAIVPVGQSSDPQAAPGGGQMVPFTQQNLGGTIAPSQAVLLRRVRRMYIEKVIRNSERLAYDERVDIKSAVTHPMAQLANMMAHTAVTCYWIVALVLVLLYTVHFDDKTALLWLYSCITSWIFMGLCLESIKLVLGTILEIQQYNLRRRAKDHKQLYDQVLNKKNFKMKQMTAMATAAGIPLPKAADSGAG